jgi:hypothetical protein
MITLHHLLLQPTAAICGLAMEERLTPLGVDVHTYLCLLGRVPVLVFSISFAFAFWSGISIYHTPVADEAPCLA